jgi:flagellar protein FliO/FliZ
MTDAVAPGAPVMPWFEALLALLIVLALLGSTLWLLSRGLTRRGASGALMSVESSRSLGERRSLVVIGVEGRRLMIGLAPGQVHLVTELQRAPGRGERVE